ncbi:MAG TPA: hypothetical protein VGF45_21135 [Polyangia bacterium]
MRTLPMQEVLRGMGLSKRTSGPGQWSRTVVRLPEPGERASALLAGLPLFTPAPTTRPARRPALTLQ